MKDTQEPFSLKKISPIIDFYHLHVGQKSLTMYSPLGWVSLDPTVQFNWMGPNLGGHVKFREPPCVVHLDGPNSGPHPRQQTTLSHQLRLRIRVFAQ